MAMIWTHTVLLRYNVVMWYSATEVQCGSVVVWCNVAGCNSEVKLWCNVPLPYPHLSESIQCELVEGGVLQLLQHRGQDVVQGPGSHLNTIL